MKTSRPVLIAALALCALPVLTPAGEAPAPATPADTEKQLAEAQKRLDAAVKEVTELSTQVGRRFAMRMGSDSREGGPGRALLGVGIGNGDEKDGAHVLNVSPGGPAAEAGIKPGDVITSIGGEDITKDSNPGRALVERMSQVQPNLKVQVGVLRDGKKMNFDVSPRPLPPRVLQFRMQRDGDGPRGPGPIGPMGPEGDRAFMLPGGPGVGRPNPEIIERIRERFGDGEWGGDEPGTRFHGIEFATLSDRLGSYFGVKSGVLVVRAGANSPFKLQDGDVILSIDGREASSAQHAGRILRSYQPGEKLTLRVQRDRKAQNLEVTAPGAGRGD